jgi:lipopolysaccharide transport system permease protein
LIVAGESVVITPSRGWQPIRLADLWEHRELVYFLIWRDLKVRYKQTIVGAAWVVVQPVVSTVIFTIIFGRLAQLPSDGLPYGLFAFAAMVPWTMFAASVNQGTRSVTGGGALISRVYFPRLLLPVSSVLSYLVDLAIGLAILVVVMAFYGYVPGVEVLALPLFLALLMVTAFGACSFLGALNAQYRDVAYVTPFVLQIWLYATPIVYAASLIPEQWQWLYSLNPMVAVVNGFRWCFLGGPSPFGVYFVISVAAALVIAAVGVVTFKRMERNFVDVL